MPRPLLAALMLVLACSAAPVTLTPRPATPTVTAAAKPAQVGQAPTATANAPVKPPATAAAPAKPPATPAPKVAPPPATPVALGPSPTAKPGQRTARVGDTIDASGIRLRVESARADGYTPVPTSTPPRPGTPPPITPRPSTPVPVVVVRVNVRNHEREAAIQVIQSDFTLRDRSGRSHPVLPVPGVFSAGFKTQVLHRFDAVNLDLPFGVPLGNAAALVYKPGFFDANESWTVSLP